MDKLSLNIEKEVAKDSNSLVFSIRQEFRLGETHVIHGDTGVGKTTLLKEILNILCDSGNSVAYMFQDVVLHPNMTVAKHLVYYSKDNSNNSDGLLKQTNLWKHKNKKPKHLSGGQRKMLSLICCLIHQPTFLLLDEPFVGMDIKTKENVISILHEYQTKSNCTCFLITHDRTIPPYFTGTAMNLVNGQLESAAYSSIQVSKIDSSDNEAQIILKTSDGESIHISQKLFERLSKSQSIEIKLPDDQ